MQIIDLSTNIEDTLSEPMKVKINTQPHSGGTKFGRKLVFFGKGGFATRVKKIIRYVNGSERITKNSFPDKEFINEERISLSTHTGTHMDAPAHFGTTCENRKPKTIDEIPLEWCYGDGVLLDFSNSKPGEEITVENIKDKVKAIGYTLKPLDIVLIYTGTDKLWGKPDYFYHAPGLGREAVAYLISEGIKIIGIDTYSLDRPIMTMVNDYYKTKDKRVLWPAHFIGREYEYCHIERLANLNKIKRNFGFKVSCFPIKLKGLSAGWIRAVAIIEEEKDDNGI